MTDYSSNARKAATDYAMGNGLVTEIQGLFFSSRAVKPIDRIPHTIHGNVLLPSVHDLQNKNFRRF